MVAQREIIRYLGGKVPDLSSGRVSLGGDEMTIDAFDLLAGERGHHYDLETFYDALSVAHCSCGWSESQRQAPFWKELPRLRNAWREHVLGETR